MTNIEVDQIITSIEAMWPQRPIDPTTRQLWGLTLRKYAAAPVMRVLQVLVEISKWRPSLAEILAPLQDAPDIPHATEAFANVWSQIGRLPGEQDVTPMEAEAVRRMGGWDALGRLQIDERHWHAKRFAEIWEALVESKRGQDLRALVRGDREALPAGTKEIEGA